MKIVEILDRANEAYPNGQLGRYYDGTTGDYLNGWGDSLAYMLVGLLRYAGRSSYNTQEQLTTAIRGIQDKINILTAVQQALTEARSEDLERNRAHESYPTNQRSGQGGLGR